MAQKSASGKRRGLKLLLVGILLGAGALYGAHWSLRATSTTGFCVSCHSIDGAAEAGVAGQQAFFQ